MATVLGRWLFGWRVVPSNQYIDFTTQTDPGSTDTHAAVLRLGDYTAAQFAAEVQRAMRAETGTTDIDVSFSFSTRQFTIAIDSPANMSLLWNTGTNAANGAHGLLGFDESGDDTTDNTDDGDSYTSDSAVAGTHSDVFTWAPTEPAVSFSPVTAAADGSAASKLQRRIRAVQQETDGGLRETVHFSTDKIFRIHYRYLSTSEQTNMESLLDWLVTGAPVNFQPDTSSTNALRLVLVNTMEIANAFSWPTRSEVDFPELVFAEQLERT